MTPTIFHFLHDMGGWSKLESPLERLGFRASLGFRGLGLRVLAAT